MLVSICGFVRVVRDLFPGEHMNYDSLESLYGAPKVYATIRLTRYSA